MMAMPTEPRVTDNPQASRYELWLGTTCAGFIQYRAEPSRARFCSSTPRSTPPWRARGWASGWSPAPWRISAPVGSSSSLSVRSSVPTCAATQTRPTWSLVTRPSPGDHGDPR
jgi:hypothetical protein